MSTKLYTYRIVKEEFWEFHKTLRSWYRENYEFLKLVRKQEGWDSRSLKSKLDDWELVEKASEEFSVEIQVFDEGNTYLLRVLEQGLTFRENYAQQQWPVAPVFYDNRMDVPPEEEKNAPVAEWVDEQIRLGRYFVAPILSSHEIFEFWWESLRSKAKA